MFEEGLQYQCMIIIFNERWYEGMVVKESLMHEGSQFRNFEGEADRNHHGDLANPLYSDAVRQGRIYFLCRIIFHLDAYVNW